MTRPFSLAGYLMECPVCHETAGRVRVRAATDATDGTAQDRYKCMECGSEFEDEAFVEVPLNQATFGAQFKQ